MTTDEKVKAGMVALSIVIVILTIILVYLRFFSGYVPPEAARATYGAEQFILQLTAMAAGK